MRSRAGKDVALWKREAADVHVDRGLRHHQGRGGHRIGFCRWAARAMSSVAAAEKARELIQSGKLGEVTMIRAAYNR